MNAFRSVAPATLPDNFFTRIGEDWMLITAESSRGEVNIRLEHPKYNQEFSRQMCSHDRVMECFYITGDFDYMARISAGSTEELW